MKWIVFFLLIPIFSFSQESGSLKDAAMRYDSLAIRLKYSFWGQTKFYDQAGEVKAGFLGSGLKDRFDKYEQCRLSLDLYKKNQIRFASFYFPGLLLMLASPFILNASDDERVFWTAAGGGLVLSMVGIKFYSNGKTALFSGVWEYNRAVAFQN